MTPSDDVFLDAQGQPRIVRGVTIYSESAHVAELASRVGFETAWIDLEHGPASFKEARDLCLAVEVGGGVATLRLPDAQRCHILRALEIGARIIVVPMVDDAETARQVVRFGKFAPLGQRGFHTRTRGVGFGLEPVPQMMATANRRSHLLAQIETATAVKNLDAILAVEGLSGILVGPGDLSVSLGKAGELKDAGLIATVVDCLRKARAAGKHAGILVAPGPMLTAALAAGADLVYVGGDIADLAPVWKATLAGMPTRPQA